MKDDEGTEALRHYFEPYAEIAASSGTGFILESPTWRASPGWAQQLGYSDEELDALNRKAIALMEEIRERYESPDAPIVISGCIGPQGDGYSPETKLSADEAEEYHSTQIETFADTAADMVTAITMTYSDEAIGVTRAAAAAGMPVAINFTVETDGRLPSEELLGDAIAAVVDATDDGPAYFGINCAHPTHFDDVLDGAGEWRERIRSLRANASTKSHAELDEATELDAGDPDDLGRATRASATSCPTSTWSEDAAAPTTAMSGRSPRRWRAADLHCCRAGGTLRRLVACHSLGLGDESAAAGQLDVEGRPEQEGEVRDPHPDHEDDRAGIEP